MANEVKLPRLGQGMEAGTITKWLKSEGETVEKGEPLFEIDTDKVTQEVESDYAGVLLKIALPEGEAPVGQTIAWIGEAGEEVADTPARAQDTGMPQSAEKPAEAHERDGERASGRDAAAAAAEAQPAPVAGEANGGRIKASPLARRIARERGIELSSLRGTGPDGRIVAEDVERGAVATPCRTGAGTDGRGRVDPADEHPQDDRPPADRGVAGAGLPAHRQRRHDARERARRARARAEPGRAHHRHRPAREGLRAGADAPPRRQRAVHRGRAAAFPTANVGIAVAAPQGLVVPVLRSVERLSLAEVAAARGDVVGRARDNKLTAQDLEDGTFTISNLGMFGIEQFVAVHQPAAGGDPRGRRDRRHAGRPRRRGRDPADDDA